MDNNVPKENSQESIEAWEQKVNPKELYDELIGAVVNFVILGKTEQVTLPLWILHSHFIKPPKEKQLCNHSPILNIFSPVRACGKSTLREVLEELCPRPISMSNGTISTIFRLISSRQPTLFIDEADTFLENRTELIGILNEGYKQKGKVFRQGGKNMEETMEFSTWGAKCIVGIGNLPDALQSRCIGIQLKRKLPHESVYRLNEKLKENHNYFHNIQRKIVRFVQDYEQEISNIDLPLNPNLDDRSQDNWLPLLKIAKFIDDDVYKWACEASENLSIKNKDTVDFGVEILKDFKKIFETENSEKISTQTVVSYLKNTELVWDSLYKGGINAYQISKLLKPFGITPKQYRGGQNNPIRGYLIADFKEVFARYLS